MVVVDNNVLDTAIKFHIENERARWIKPDNNPIVNHDAELHIKTIEQAPRDSKSIEALIAKKRIEMKAASSIFQNGFFEKSIFMGKDCCT